MALHFVWRDTGDWPSSRPRILRIKRGSMRRTTCSEPEQWSQPIVRKLEATGYALSPGGRSAIDDAFFSAASVSSTVISTVVSQELSAPPALIANTVAAMETLSGASHKLYASWSPNEYQKPCSFPPTASMHGSARRCRPRHQIDMTDADRRTSAGNQIAPPFKPVGDLGQRRIAELARCSSPA